MVSYLLVQAENFLFAQTDF